MTEEQYNQAVASRSSIVCTHCQRTLNYKSIKQHLKNVHGYRYTENSKDFPAEVTHE